jgi:phage baseplate assembly protein W
MSTNNLELLEDEGLSPDPESEQEFQIDPSDEISPQAVVPEFDDQTFDATPVDTYDEYGNILQYRIEAAVPLNPIGRTWAFDFSKGEFDMQSGGTPKRLADNDTRIIQQWIRRALTTERLSYGIYPPEFGVELAPVLNNSLTGPAAIAHIVNTVQEALTYHDRINLVSNVRVTDQGGRIFVSAEVKLEQGELLPVNVPLGEV